VFQNDQIDENYVLAYTPDEKYIQTTPILIMASKAIAALWINFYSNKAQQLVQEAG
jgi:hypothetical protein